MYENVTQLHNVQKLEFEYNDNSNQQGAAKFVLLNLLSLLYMFRASVLPIFRSTFDTDWMELHPICCHQLAADSRVGTLFKKLYEVC